MTTSAGTLPVILIATFGLRIWEPSPAWLVFMGALAQGAGNYSLADFVKVEAPLALVVGGVALILTPLPFKF